MRRTLGIGGYIIAAVLAGTVLALAIAVGIAPALLGESSRTIMTQSMAHKYNPGDVVVDKAQHVRDYQIGDVITFQPNSGDPATTTHRIVGVTLGDGRDSVEGVAGFITRGDANNVNDKPIVPAQVQGKVLYSVPLIGYGIEWVKQAMPPISKASLMMTLGEVLVFGGLLFVVVYFTPWRRLFRRSPHH
ncbi:signal peptidase I [Pseudarthrobacter phenanthrenivorans]|uniref:signal peptidase I n=1 Tax=Pseudarthrobacter phenanthrenivorans TaxID=361575 RepID=UPI00344F0566